MEMSQGRQKASLYVAQCLLYGIHGNGMRITYSMSELWIGLTSLLWKFPGKRRRFIFRSYGKAFQTPSTKYNRNFHKSFLLK